MRHTLLTLRAAALAALIVCVLAWPASATDTLLVDAVTTSGFSSVIKSTTNGASTDTWTFVATLNNGARARLEASLDGVNWAPIALFLPAPAHTYATPSLGPASAVRWRVYSICPAGSSVSVTVTTSAGLTPQVIP